MSKIEERRERRILEAVKIQNWQEVCRLLDQNIKNQERKDRYYNLLSLNSIIVNEGRTTEFLDYYADNTFNPINQLLVRELREHLIIALSKLREEDRYIFLQVALNNKSALQLTKETKYSSHKTIQRHFEKARKILIEELKNYY